jgi:hypothetical protein
LSKKYLTLDDLLLFCKENNFNHFSANDAGGPIVVHTPGLFEATDSSKNGLLPVKLQACHTGLNRNNSHISTETMNAALPSFSNRPILGYIHQLEDGSWDFYSHNMELVEDEHEDDGMRLDYLEVPVGIVPESCNAHLEFDESKEKTYVQVDAYIFEEYSKAADIIREKGVSKVSVELAIEDMSFNAKEGYLSINSFYFMGVTILGRDEEGNFVQEGMEGSNITLGSFSQENNSVVTDDMQSKMFELLTKLNDALEKFNDTNDSEKKGGNEMNKFEELLELYGLTAEEIDFEVEGLSDEELESAFTEKFGSAEEYKTQNDAQTDNDDGGSDGDDGSEGDEGDPAPSGDEEKYTLTYELSHDDIRMGLYGLLNSTIGEDSYAWICEVFDDYFIYNKETCNESGYDSQYYRQSYSRDGDEIIFGTDPVEVFPEFVSADEKAALAALRLEYAELKAFKESVEAQALQAQKDEIFNDEKYSVLNGNEKFEQLKNDAINFSVEEISNKCKVIFAEYVMEVGSYSASVEKKENEVKKIGFNFNKKSKKAEAYAGLFSEN